MKPREELLNNKQLHIYDVSKMTIDEWRGFRSSLDKIGGSDVGTICGLNPYKDPLLFFYEKIGLKQDNFSGNIYTTLGKFLEDGIVSMWNYGNTMEEITMNFGQTNPIRSARNPQATILNPEYPLFAANPDALIYTDPEYDYMGTGVLEIKKMSKRVSEQYLGGIPPSYIYQLQTYMLVTNAPFGYIAALVGETDFISIPYIFDVDIVKEILDKCTQFEEVVKIGRDIMKKSISLEEKLKELYTLEDSFDVLQTLAYDKLSEFYSEPMMEDLRTQKIASSDVIEQLAASYYDAQQLETHHNKDKTKYGALLKKELMKDCANEVSSFVYDGDSYSVKFKKRLTVNKKNDRSNTDTQGD